MASFGVKTIGIEGVKRNVDRYIKEADDATTKALVEAAISIRGDWVRNVKKWPYHDTHGRYATSIRYDLVRRHHYRVRDGVVYGARLEFGFMATDILGRTFNQQPRPTARPAIRDNANKIPKDFRTQFQHIR